MLQSPATTLTWDFMIPLARRFLFPLSTEWLTGTTVSGTPDLEMSPHLLSYKLKRELRLITSGPILLILTRAALSRDAWSGGQFLNSAQGNGERAENDRERQGPEAELDFQHGPGGTAADETGYAGEGHACPASGFGELAGVSPATSERRQVNS